MTAEDLKCCGIPVEDDDIAVLTAESALEYIKANTILKFDMNDIESVKELPSCAKLFVMKYCELMERESGIASESIDGLSQSFDTSDKESQLYALFNSLLGRYAVSQLESVPRIRRYRYGH